MIKAAAKKVQKENFKSKMKKKSAGVRKASKNDLERYEREQQKIDKALEKLNDNTHMYWNDASSYTKQYYGDVYQETTKFDNEWN